MLPEKLPPHDIEAEEAVLGSLLIDSEALYKVISFLRPDDFYREKNRWAYEACLELFNRSEAINEVTAAHELSLKPADARQPDRGSRLDEVGGAGFLSRVVSQVPTSLHIEHYAQIVSRTALLRRLIEAGARITAIGYDGGANVEEALRRAEDILFAIRQSRAKGDFVRVRDLLEQFLEESAYVPPVGERGLAHVNTGFMDLDKILAGMQRSDLIVLAARPSLGKSSLALNIARNAALNQGATVAIFSLEMSKEQLVQRLLASESGIDTQRLRLGQHSEAEEEKVVRATGVLSEALIYIDDTPVISVVEMHGKARRLHNERQIDLIVVDYLQLMRGNGRAENRVQEMSVISQSLKGLARDLSVPVLAVSQLSRAVEQRTPHIPILSDLRESGSIEQDADVVLFIYREDVYFDREIWERMNPGKVYPQGIADIIVAKHRNGPTGKLHLYFREKIARFENLETRRERNA